MNKALYLLAIFLLVTPLSIAVADDGDWYVSVMPVFTDDDPDRRLAMLEGLSTQLHIFTHYR